MVELLLGLGHANVNATDSENRSALHSAAWQGHAAIVNLLLQHKAKTDHACNQGATPLGKRHNSFHFNLTVLIVIFVSR